ncbi:Thioredoxin-related protein [Salinivirga cyanobacteriivorans]|uniref:Thioredoxin-related protein n=1 Tax=Salinivirga cyanobacteriivorans TaxID=1307839 RepID=A0A0S2I548_9BACT|nr:thioredoxin domain-containing protein [Salinivirga cyanobacteriivorans]ALO17323.1 Thioredoxin-related protein [Salinivirga cyanobacteriivorans]
MSNRLKEEHSLYLQQHAENPVDWFPWSDEAFEKARDENKLLIVSIGYSSCHWCHVMEHNVFEHDDAATLMNKHFVSVKVDREERPDVDHIYMDAVQMITGRGGWPLNVFVLPDGRPFYGGTYFPKEQWMSLIERLAITYKERPELIRSTAEEIQNKIAQNEEILQTNKPREDDVNNLSVKLLKQWEANFDSEHGGEKGAPKFPMPARLSAVYNAAISQNHTAIKNQTLFTLKQMAAGGIYDQVGGGFARYAVDSQWRVPHFEKMLYDNAQLLPLYAKAASIEQDEVFKMVLNESFSFLIREMEIEPGLFASAIDADSEGVEGKFYTWTYQDFKKVVPDDQWADFFSIIKPGNWEGTNVLHYQPGAMDQRIHDEQGFLAALNKVKSKLLSERNKRVRPVRDEKAITSWNAMLAASLFESYKYVKDTRFIEVALEILNRVKQQWKTKGHLPRILNYDSATGMLDDYAYTVLAFYSAYEITHNQEWLNLAQTIFSKTLEVYDVDKSLLNYYPASEQMFARKTEWMDTVIPSSNALIANVAFDLGYVLKNTGYTQKGQKMLQTMTELMQKHPLMLGAWMEAAQNSKEKIYVNIGKNYSVDKVRSLFAGENIYPDILPSKELDNNEIMACKGNTCFKPVNTIDEAIKLVKP